MPFNADMDYAPRHRPSRVVCAGGSVPNPSLGSLIRSRRLALGMSQRRLGDLVGEDQTTISQWERGKVKRPGDDKLRALGAALEWTWEETAKAAGLILVVGAPEEVSRGADEVPIPDWGQVPATAGEWAVMQQRGDSVDIPRKWVDEARSPLVAVTISGDCLRGCTPAISDGDIVVCQTHNGRPQDVPNGTLVLVRVGADYTLRVWNRCGTTIELSDGDGNVAQTLTETDDCEILGTFYKRFSS